MKIQQVSYRPPAASSGTVCVNPEQSPGFAIQLHTLQWHPATYKFNIVITSNYDSC